MAPASAASAGSRTAGNDREPDHPYATTLTSRSGCPGSRMVDTIVRPRWGKLSDCTSVPGGPSTTWSITAATIRALSRVECTKPARAPREASARSTNGAVNAAAALGSPSGTGSCSLATSSDCTTIRVVWFTGSTSKQMAAIDRCTKDTIRVEVTLTAQPAGETHSA